MKKEYREVTSFSLSPAIIQKIKKGAKGRNISRHLEGILQEYFNVLPAIQKRMRNIESQVQRLQKRKKGKVKQ